MNDRKVSFGSVVANVLWALVALCLLASWVIFDHLVADRLAQTGLALSAAAATATIRGYFCDHDHQVHLAFKYGRESAGHDDDPRVRSLG